MSKIDRPVYPIDIVEDIGHKYKLTKVDTESFSKLAVNAKWVEWDLETDKFKKLHTEPAVGLSLILDPQYGASFTWMTTIITEIIEQTDSHILFKTLNSFYKLEYL